ncbi:MAG: two-component system response regulator [Gammaproteobacteria bacterium]|nr:MAG: two-component system response regulator [Gammaproteobacteria bacterium]RLA23653.1 MAG: two-component system response regulator [Gammaproteobacteria bacterium]
MHILIVDDVTDNIQVVMNILKEDGYSFSYATQGTEALELIERDFGQLDLILLDIMMPGTDGFSVCQTVKSNPLTAQIPVIFLTAKTDVDSIRKGFSLGAVDYITKPFHAEELLARVNTHTQLYQAKKVLQQNNLALNTKIKFEHKRLLSELENNQKEMIWMLTGLMESTSDETGQHIRRVSELSALLAHYHPALSDDDAEIVRHASPMHDIGKMTIPYEILHKPGRYTEEEFNEMKAHTSNAYNLLCCSDRKLMSAAAIIAHEHHEKWNGKGYPRGLKGSKIHIYGRIVALADVFDALTHSRRYKKAWNIDEVVNYIKDHDGTQFDPELVAIFLEHLDEFAAIAKIK